MDVPRLIESGVRQYLEYGLRKARDVRVNAYFYIFNAAVITVFAGIVGGFMWTCYRPRLSDEDRARKVMRDQQLILAKIRGYQAFAGPPAAGALTGLAAAGDRAGFGL